MIRILIDSFIIIHPGNGVAAMVMISQTVTPNAHTSDLVEKVLELKISGAHHGQRDSITVTAVRVGAGR